MPKVRFMDLAKYAILFGLYFLTAIYGLKLDAVSGFATLVWLPTGLSLAFLFIFGLRFWPAIAAGAFLANYVTGAPVLGALGISIGNTLEAVVGVYLLKNIVKLNPALDSIRDVIGLVIAAALVSTSISATVGVTSLWLTGVVSLSAYGPTWLAWWTGDLISNLVIAPLILVWSTRARITINPRLIAELGVILLVLAAIGLVVFSGDTQNPLTFLLFPPLIWAALRFSPREAITITFLLSAVSVWSTANGFGPFAKTRLSDSLIFLQSFMSVMTFTVMLMAAAASERRRLEEKKDEFISIASHELRSPLATLGAVAQTLQMKFKKIGDEQALKYLEPLNGQIKKLAQLVLDLLDVTKIEEGKIALHKSSFNINQLISEVIKEISLEDSSHSFIIQGEKNAHIYADRNRVSQVLSNLLSNAVKYSPDADKVIIHLVKKTGSLTVSIQDFGVGISGSHQKNIFNRFYQIGEADSKPGANLGLGLYIAKELVERHGGSIWVESKKGEGSVFSFKLPDQ